MTARSIRMLRAGLAAANTAGIQLMIDGDKLLTWCWRRWAIGLAFVVLSGVGAALTVGEKNPTAEEIRAAVKGDGA